MTRAHRTEPRIAPLGDAALTVEFGEEIDRSASARALALDAALASDPPDGLIETAPSFRAVFVAFDPLLTDFATVSDAVRTRLAASGGAEAGAARLWRLPTVYDGADLGETADALGLSADALVEAHAGLTHHCYMVGFLPGCPYLGDLPDALYLPRLSTPRTRVPAGSVAIAVGLTVVYPVESPGGWRILGRTPAPLFDPDASEPALLSPGDRIRFEPTDAARFDALKNDGWRPEPEAL